MNKYRIEGVPQFIFTLDLEEFQALERGRDEQLISAIFLLHWKSKVGKEQIVADMMQIITCINLLRVPTPHYTHEQWQVRERLHDIFNNMLRTSSANVPMWYVEVSGP